MALKLNSSGGGSVTIDPVSTASNVTITVPATTGGSVVVADSSGNVSATGGVSGTTGTFTGNLLLSSNVGIGVTPATWNQSKAIQINTIGSLRADTATVGINNNAYFNAGWKYLTTATATIYEQNTGGHYWRIAPSGTADTAITFTQAMELDASGQLNLYSTKPSISLESGTNSIYWITAQSAGNYFSIGGSGGTAPTLGKINIDISNVGIGVLPSAFSTHTNAQVSTYFAGTVYLRGGTNTSGRYWGISSENAASASLTLYNAAGTGQYMAYGTTAWTANSDERLKTTVTPFSNAIEKVCTLRAGTGRYLTDDESVSRSFLIAQDVQQVLPEAVDVQEDEIGTLGLRYTEVIPLLTAAIQEQQALIASLTARITALENN